MCHPYNVPFTISQGGINIAWLGGFACLPTNAVPKTSSRAIHYLTVSSLSKFVHLIINILFFPSEPQNLTIDQVTAASFRVSFQAPSGAASIEKYEVVIQGGCIEKGCSLDKSATPLQCEFSGLLPATKYAVRVRSCLPNSLGCSKNVTGLVVTTPAGKPNAISI